MRLNAAKEVVTLRLRTVKELRFHASIVGDESAAVAAASGVDGE